MDREEDLRVWLGERSLGDPTVLRVTDLVDLGIKPSDLGELDSLFGRDILPVVLGRATLRLTVGSLIGEIQRGSERIVGIVKALKSYSYMDRDILQSVDINEGLDDTLVMLAGVLREGVTIRRNYDTSLPTIIASGGELNQVWTNLIDNAVDAMDGAGELAIQTQRDGDEAVVRITDSGQGIPTGLRDTLFDPFVTSKAVGKGTGLGLNISHNIVVRKHKGSISVESEPGRTCFEVRLPIQRSDQTNEAIENESVGAEDSR